MFRFIVLGLRLGRTLHGYALMKATRRAGVRMSTGRSTASCRTLVSDGLVRTVEREPDDDAPHAVPGDGVGAPRCSTAGSSVRRSSRSFRRHRRRAHGTHDVLYEAPAETAHQMIESWKEELAARKEARARPAERDPPLHERRRAVLDPHFCCSRAARVGHRGRRRVLDELRTALEERHAGDAAAAAQASLAKGALAVTPRGRAAPARASRRRLGLPLSPAG